MEINSVWDKKLGQARIDPDRLFTKENRDSGGDMDSVIVLLIAIIALVLLVWFVLHDQFVGLMLAMLKLEARLISVGICWTSEGAIQVTVKAIILNYYA